MKTLHPDLQAHYNSGATCMAYGLVVRREDGALYGFTSHDQDVPLDASPWFAGAEALVLDARQGLDFSGIVSTAGFAVDNMEITTLDDGTLFDRDDVLAGRWQNAEFWIFRHRWDVPAVIPNSVEVLYRGWFGQVVLQQTVVKVELRGLTQKLQQPVGIVSTKTCRARLGATTGINRCMVDLTPWTYALAVATVTDKRTFTFAGTLPDDTLGEGLVTWTSGDNAGTTHKVRTHTATGGDPVTGGTVTLQLPCVLAIQVGDTFTAVAGCRKRLLEDCRDKFNNVLNFQGEPHRPSFDDLAKPV